MASARAEMLVAGGLSMFGLGLSDYFRLQDAQASEPRRERSFGRAKSCILLPLRLAGRARIRRPEAPNAPVEIRGELGSIRSTLPGCDVCELLPSVSRVMDKMTVVRSMTHPHPIHGVAYATTGTPVIDIPMELNPRDGRHHPYIGSVVDYLVHALRDAVVILHQAQGHLRRACPPGRGIARRPYARLVQFGYHHVAEYG